MIHTRQFAESIINQLGRDRVALYGSLLQKKVSHNDVDLLIQDKESVNVALRKAKNIGWRFREYKSLQVVNEHTQHNFVFRDRHGRQLDLIIILPRTDASGVILEKGSTYFLEGSDY